MKKGHEYEPLQQGMEGVVPLSVPLLSALHAGSSHPELVETVQYPDALSSLAFHLVCPVLNSQPQQPVLGTVPFLPC